MNKNIRKIAITGPESTGKSTLAAALAAHYNTAWVPEFARTYLETLSRPYAQQDVESIARGQLESYQQVLAGAKNVLFADTDLLVIKIWMLNAYGNCPDWILEALLKQDFDLYLLPDIDLPWEEDPQREHPHLRQYFYDWYKRELKQYGFNFVEISGTKEVRFQNALNHVNALLQNR
ncbi:AAA family ATPase [Adhaeribacter aquaticus]|uniref:AAA family ATPase n=1 Tax=Adhaeribacter aquaticus TaxID=299567 RepID=UPI00040BF09F|nr:ATP-binding protein [Adhaeribacter aquaticus]